jgi:hypothetical protein
MHPRNRASGRAPLRHFSRCAAVALAVAMLRPAQAAADDEGPSATPYRPSVSVPAALSAPGWLEIEAGLQQNHDGVVARRDSAPLTFKLAFTPDWGVRLGIDGWVHTHDDPDSESGVGDTSVVLKRRFAVSDATAWGLELGETFPTAKSSIGIGHAATTVNGIFSSDFAPAWHTDINLNVTHLGGSGQPSPWQTGWAAAFSRTLTDTWGAVGELSGTYQASYGNTAQFLAAASWNQSPAAVFDFGFARGLNDATPRWQVFAGVTVRLGKVF